MDYDTEWARRYPARLGRVLVSELVARPGRAGAGVAPGSRPGSHRPPRRAGHLRRQPRQPPRCPAAPVGHPGALAAPACSWRARPTTSSTPALKAATLRLPAQRRADRTPAGEPRLRQPGRGTCWPTAGACSSSPKAGAAPTAGASRTGPGRPGWPSARAGRSCRCTSKGPAQILAKGSTRLRPGTTHVTFGRPLRAEPGERPPAAGRRPGAGHGRPRRRADHRLVDGPASGRRRGRPRL